MAELTQELPAAATKRSTVGRFVSQNSSGPVKPASSTSMSAARPPTGFRSWRAEDSGRRDHADEADHDAVGRKRSGSVVTNDQETLLNTLADAVGDAWLVQEALCQLTAERKEFGLENWIRRIVGLAAKNGPVAVGDAV